MKMLFNIKATKEFHNKDVILLLLRLAKFKVEITIQEVLDCLFRPSLRPL